jgi:hypothetical protein
MLQPKLKPKLLANRLNDRFNRSFSLPRTVAFCCGSTRGNHLQALRTLVTALSGVQTVTCPASYFSVR